MHGNYSLDNIKERAKAALEHHKGYVEESLELYVQRRKRRLERGMITLAILGMGRAGKDTVAEYLGDATQLDYAGSSSNRLNKFVSHVAGIPEQQSFNERHEHREFWIAVGHAVRGIDLTLLARIGLGHGDMAVGLRGRHEVYGCHREGVIDLSIWVDNPRVPADITVEFTAADCDIELPNWGSLSELYRKLDTLIHVLKIPVRGRSQ